MKKIVMILLAFVISLPAFASNKVQIEKISQLSIELTNLRNTLEDARKEKRNSTIQAVVSLAVAGLFIRDGIRSRNSQFGDMFGGAVQFAIATVSGAYGATQVYQLSIKSEQIDTLISAISSKQLELEAAKRVLEQIE